jgi:hypothetical protein
MIVYPLSVQARWSTKTYFLARVCTHTRICFERSNIPGTCVPQVSSPELMHSRSLLGSPSGQDVQRRFVLSSDTFIILELNFVPGSSHSLTFGALEVPPICSVKCSVDSRDQRCLSLQILLVDAVTETIMQAGMQDQDNDGDNAVAQSLVDFQAEHNIIRFKLPCCFLDSRHRTGCYR